VKPPPFAYARATELGEALALMAEAGEDAKLLAGGQSLLPLLGLRLSRPTHLVDITHLPGLDEISVTESGGLTVGALVTHAELARKSGLGLAWRAVGGAADVIGHYPIRVRGTAGGSIAHADPASELPVVAIALGADVIAESHTGSRRIPAEQFFTGPFSTTLEPNEMITRIEFAPATPGSASAFEEFATRHGDFASASVAVMLARDETGRVQDVKIAVGAVGPSPLRAPEAEAALRGSTLDTADIRTAGRLAGEVCRSGGAGRASREFRRDLVEVLLGRALRRLEASS
jgi:carbon-monoxide dehydrogenase medium subunit/6-hydroxypseudooxynicotine dehydrogenase subunit alpha